MAIAVLLGGSKDCRGRGATGRRRRGRGGRVGWTAGWKDGRGLGEGRARWLAGTQWSGDGGRMEAEGRGGEGADLGTGGVGVLGLGWQSGSWQHRGTHHGPSGARPKAVGGEERGNRGRKRHRELCSLLSRASQHPPTPPAACCRYWPLPLSVAAPSISCCPGLIILRLRLAPASARPFCQHPPPPPAPMTERCKNRRCEPAIARVGGPPEQLPRSPSGVFCRDWMVPSGTHRIRVELAIQLCCRSRSRPAPQSPARNAIATTRGGVWSSTAHNFGWAGRVATCRCQREPLPALTTFHPVGSQAAALNLRSQTRQSRHSAAAAAAAAARRRLPLCCNMRAKRLQPGGRLMLTMVLRRLAYV